MCELARRILQAARRLASSRETDGGESLWFGKPCICYRHSSLPEVGGKHGIFCDLDDSGSLERAVRDAIAGKFAVQPPARAELRTWDAVTAEIVQAICTRTPAEMYRQGIGVAPA
jgi:hypothetical protein